MNDLGDIQWIFAKTNNISDLQTLKAKVIEALKTADGKPIEELEKLFVTPSAFCQKSPPKLLLLSKKHNPLTTSPLH